MRKMITELPLYPSAGNDAESLKSQMVKSGTLRRSPQSLHGNQAYSQQPRRDKSEGLRPVTTATQESQADLRYMKSLWITSGDGCDDEDDQNVARLTDLTAFWSRKQPQVKWTSEEPGVLRSFVRINEAGDGSFHMIELRASWQSDFKWPELACRLCICNVRYIRGEWITLLQRWPQNTALYITSQRTGHSWKQLSNTHTSDLQIQYIHTHQIFEFTGIVWLTVTLHESLLYLYIVYAASHASLCLCVCFQQSSIWESKRRVQLPGEENPAYRLW